MAFWWSPSVLAGAIASPPTLADGTTADALAAGSASFKWTAAIEGYPYLLTDATAQQAIDAWFSDTSTHRYTQALTGLIVVHDNQQQLDWRNPFPRGGQCTLHIMPDAAVSGGTFGRDTHKRGSGDETVLSATANRSDSTLTVKSTSTFDSSGDAHIGTECFSYSGTTGTTFTGVTRGKYVPFARTDGFSNDGFSETHRVGQNDLEVMLNPKVTSLPEHWVGKWVGLYLHKYDPSIPALNSRANALIASAGKIVSITDDPATGATVVELKHALDVVAEATIGGRDQWIGTIRNTIFLATDMTFTMKDFEFGSTQRTANNLTVKASGASGANEVDAGYYTPIEIYQKLNTWWASEVNATRLYGTYSIGYHSPSDGTIHSDIYWNISAAAAGDLVMFELTMPQLVAARLGFVVENANDVNGFAQSKIKDDGTGPGARSRLSEDGIARVFATNATNADSAIIDDETGTFKDQYTYLPGSSKPAATADDGYGIFLVDNKFLILASYDANGGPNGEPVLNHFATMSEQFGLGDPNLDAKNWRLPLTQTGPQDTSIRQIFVLEGGLADLLMRVFYSTGTDAYNSPYDTLAHGLGLAIPGELLPTAFRASCNALPHADSVIVLVIDKQIRLSTLLAGELIIRRSFLRWNESGYFEFATWQTPTESNSVATLTEANKAAPAGTLDHHRSVTSEDGGWAVPTVNIRYNRQINSSPAGGENYRDVLTIIDAGALDNLGGDGPSINIDCRGTFGDFAQTGQSADSLSAVFMATMPYFSQPARKSSRSIDQRFFVSPNLGEIVYVTDNYMRDPSTGLRGVSRYGIVIRKRWSLGGPTPNSDSVQPQGGEVDLFFLDVNRVASYVPSAQVDDTATNGGYDNADPFYLTLYPHECSRSDESEDGANFIENDEIYVIEIDPADPADPLVMTTTVVGYDAATNKLQVAELSGDVWDSSKKYRVVFRNFADAQPSQQVKTFGADDADYLVQDLRVPFDYGTGGADGSFTRWDAADPVELVPNASYGDGVGRDVGHEVALARLVNNLIQYKTGVSSPKLSTAVMSFYIGGGSATWCLVQCYPVKLGDDVFLANLYRKVAVAPHFRSNDGSSQSVRVTVSRTQPTSSSYFDVDRGSVIDSTTFSTTSTTFATPTPVELNAGVKDGAGILWVYVEVSTLAETWGLAHLQETNIRFLFPPLEL